MENYYNRLGIRNFADIAEIERGLKRAAEKQQLSLEELKQCREILFDPIKKAEYDLALKEFHPNLEGGIKKSSEKPARKTNGEPKRGCADFFALIGTGIAISAVFLIFQCDGSPSRGYRFDEFTAQVACESAVKNMLKAPATASFSSWKRKQNNDGTFSVSGEVDSQNGFGAVLRSRFSCTVRDKGDGTTGTVVDYIR